MAFVQMAQLFRGMRQDMQKLIKVLTELNKHLGDIDKAVKVMDALQKTLNANQGNLTKLVAEMEETNENIKGVLEIVKAMKD